LLTATGTRADSKQGTAIVKAITGSASYVDQAGLSHPLKTGMVLQEGDTLQTGVDSTVDLHLPHNGPAVGLNAESTLRFERLAFEETALGTVIDTRLRLSQGDMVGSVHKLLAGSRYEVRTPRGLASVRGTEFYVSAKTGDVHVITGTVQLTIYLNVTSPGDPSSFKYVTIGAGQSFYMPRSFLDNATFLAVTTAPPPAQLPTGR